MKQPQLKNTFILESLKKKIQLLYIQGAVASLGL